MNRFTKFKKKVRHIVDSTVFKPKDAAFRQQSLISEQVSQDLIIYATTVIRGSQDHDLTGYLYKIHWHSGEILKRLPIPLDTKHPFWNARGGNRGGRGLFYRDDKLYAATAMSILVYDPDLNQIGEINHPGFADIHEIYAVEDGIWVTSTVHDMIFKVDYQGETLFEWRGDQSRVLQKRYGFQERKINFNLDFPYETFEEDFDKYKLDELFHINSVWVEDEITYILSCYKNAYIKIYPEPVEIIMQDDALHFPHNGICTPTGTILVNDTKHQYLREYDLKTGRRLQTIGTSVFPHNIRGSAQFSRPGWQRGLTHVQDWIFIVGTSPATIFEVDIKNRVIGKIFTLEDDVSHSVHGLCIQTRN